MKQLERDKVIREVRDLLDSSKENGRLPRGFLGEIAQELYELLEAGYTQAEIAAAVAMVTKRNCTPSGVAKAIKKKTGKKFLHNV